MTHVHLPVNGKRILWNAQKQYGYFNSDTDEELKVTHIIENVAELFPKLIVVPGADPLSIEAQEAVQRSSSRTSEPISPPSAC